MDEDEDLEQAMLDISPSKMVKQGCKWMFFCECQWALLCVTEDTFKAICFWTATWQHVVHLFISALSLAAALSSGASSSPRNKRPAGRGLFAYQFLGPRHDSWSMFMPHSWPCSMFMPRSWPCSMFMVFCCSELQSWIYNLSIIDGKSFFSYTLHDSHYEFTGSSLRVSLICLILYVPCMNVHATVCIVCLTYFHQRFLNKIIHLGATTLLFSKAITKAVWLARRLADLRGKRRAAEQQPTGRLCKFCRKPIKQGPESPHVYHAFRGVAGRYIYCPARVLSLYKEEGMVAEMTWGSFQQSDFYKAEKKRWAQEKG